MPIVTIMGKKRVLRHLRAKRFKKEWTTADPTPWTGDPSKLSRGQVRAIINFTKIAHETRGLPLEQRMDAIKKELKGKVTGLAEPIIRVRGFGVIKRLAEAYGETVPAELDVLAEKPYVEIDPRTKKIRAEYATPPAGAKVKEKAKVEVAPAVLRP